MYVVIGAGGYLGRYLIKNLLEKTEDQVLAVVNSSKPQPATERLHWDSCDIGSQNSIEAFADRLKSYRKPYKIFFLAAYHHPDKVVEHPRTAWNINITGLSQFLNAVDNVEAFYYPSTEVVYGPSRGDYMFKEDDKLSPANKYGEHKIIAEQMVLTHGYNIARFPVLVGRSLIEDRRHFYDELLEALQQDKPIKMFTDHYRSMLDFDTAAGILVDLVNNYGAQKYPIVNVSGDEVMSKYEFGLKVAQSKKLNPDNIIPISMDDDNRIFKVKRVKKIQLDNSLVKQILNLDSLKIKIQ